MASFFDAERLLLAYKEFMPKSRPSVCSVLFMLKFAVYCFYPSMKLMSSSDRCLEDELSAPINPSKSSAFCCCKS